MTEDEGPTDFIREIVARDVEEGRHEGEVRTRFPPEPNGFLHIGHAKAICVDFGVAEEFGGSCNLRMDDTNPLTEEPKYVDAAARDVNWLGFEWEGEIRHASDYFPRFYELALQLVRDGEAYVDSLSEEEIREYRGTVTEPGRPSPYRDRSVEENLELFRAMRAGEFEDGEHVLRAKIDLSASNMKLRDPLLYRILHADHYRTGDEWPIYPMYDWAHPLGDAIEGITHSFCTLEFEENRALYDWVVENTRPDGPDSEPGSWTPRPRQYEFSRLNLDYTVMSKRKLARLVRGGHVDGWDDPRLPTLAGLRRRGVPPASVRDLCEMVGVSRSEQQVQMSALEHVIRDRLNREAPRVMCVLRPLKMVIENYPEDEVEVMETPAFPRDVDREGDGRQVPFTKELYIERDDFRLDPPEGYYRLAPGREVRLRHGYVVRCTDVVRDPESGEVSEVRCTYDPDTRGGRVPDDRTVPGTIHWVSAERSLPVEVRLYDRLFDVPYPEEDTDDFTEHLNPDSLEVLERARIEPGVAREPAWTRYQFYRQGYFIQDEDEEVPLGPGFEEESALVFNRIVHLRDPWAEREAKEEEGAARAGASEGDGDVPVDELPPEQRPGADHERRVPESRRRAREEHPELAERFRRYQEGLGLPEADADVLTGDPAVNSFYEEALESGAPPQPTANWLIHELRGELGRELELADLPFGGAELGKLAELVEDGTLSQPAARDVLSRLIEEGGSPASIVEEEGLERISDRRRLESLARRLAEQHAEKVERYRGGQEGLLGFFVGQVMQETSGRADPELAKEILRERLSDEE